jgi:chromosome segregation ATPase
MLEIALSEARNTSNTDFQIREFQNQQSYFEQESRNLKREISDLKSSLNFQVQLTADAQRNAQLYRDQLESSDRDKNNLRIQIEDLEKQNRELSERLAPTRHLPTTEPVEPAEISSMTDATGEFEAARAAIKSGRKSRRKPKN